MTLPQIIEQTVALPQAGVYTSDSRYNEGFMASIINAARAVIVTERWKQYGKVPAIYYQKYNPDYSKVAQDETNCYSIFYGIPNIISLDGRSTGLGYIGSTDELNLFREVSTPAALASMLSSRIIAKQRKPIALIGTNGELKIYYKTKVKLPEIQAIFSDPREIPSYNVDFDDYPMDISDIPKMQDFLLKGSFGLTYKTPLDRVNDSRDISVPPNVRP